MKRFVLASFAVAGLMLTVGTAQARHHRHGCGGESCASSCSEGCAPSCGEGCAPSCEAPAVTYAEQKVTRYRPEWHEREVKVTVNKLQQKEVVDHYNVTICTPVWTEQEQVSTVYRRVAHEVVKHVTCCHMVQSCCVDPCTGCSHTVCHPETTVQEVRCTEWECVPTQEKHMVKVCTYRQEQKTVESKHLVCEWVPTVETRKESYCTMVAHEETIRVPVCAPAASCGGCGSASNCGGCGGCGGCS